MRATEEEEEVEEEEDLEEEEEEEERRPCSTAWPSTETTAETINGDGGRAGTHP